MTHMPEPVLDMPLPLVLVLVLALVLVLVLPLDDVEAALELVELAPPPAPPSPPESSPHAATTESANTVPMDNPARMLFM